MSKRHRRMLRDINPLRKMKPTTRFLHICGSSIELLVSAPWVKRKTLPELFTESATTAPENCQNAWNGAIDKLISDALWGSPPAPEHMCYKPTPASPQSSAHSAATVSPSQSDSDPPVPG